MVGGYMKARLSILALALLGGMATAGVVTVWDHQTGNGKDIHPYGKWYTYATAKTSASAGTSTTSTGKLMLLTIDPNDDVSNAGVGFGWGAKADSIKNLSDYSGVCLTYTAKAEFRMDFKQSTITDYNYNGVVVPAQTSMGTVYFPFEDFAQESWGKVKKALDLTKQTGVQFTYKYAYYDENGVKANTIKIANISFGTGTSCVNHAPSLKTGVSATDADDLLEGEVYEVALKNIFQDEDGDPLNITVAIADENSVDVTGKKSYSLSDVVKLKSMSNPPAGTTSTITFTAKDDGGLTATYKLVLTLIDRQNAPVAVDDAYEVNEDAVLTVASSKGIKHNDYDDDGDKAFDVTIKSEPEHGEFTFNGNGFVYTPVANFYGTDSFTYTITDASGLESNVATVTITVKNVDDPATLTITDSTFRIGSASADPVNFEDGISVKEDFDDFDIFISMDAFDISDPDVLTSNFPIYAASKNGKVDVVLDMTTTNYVISVIAVPNANGSDVIKLFAIDGKDSVGIDIPITIAAVPDKPVAVPDTFRVGQDMVTKIAAKDGVLKNDFNPDGKSALKASLAEDAVKGKVELAEDGSFTYEIGDYEGKDTFSYFVTNESDETSEIVTVVLVVEYRNRPPQVLAGVQDTVGKRTSDLREDFTNGIVFKADEVSGWFEDPEGDAITFKATTPDSIVTVTSNTIGAITVRGIKNACGETTVDVVATDAEKNSTTLSIPVSVKCVNDPPGRIGKAVDTIIVAPNGWREAFYVFDLFEDVDDTVLTMKVTAANKEKVIDAQVEGDSLIVKLFDEKVYLQYKVVYTIKVTVTDGAGATATAKTLGFLADSTKVAAVPVVATATKMGWQGAITANNGMATMMDVQGRVMWQRKLPVSEADVRNAAAKVQGRKVLRVNNQTWTIK